MKISVTAGHIKNGDKNSYSYCPVALAFKDAGFPDAQVGTRTVKLTNKSKKLNLPVEVSYWIYRFDSSNRVSLPIEFELNEPNN